MSETDSTALDELAQLLSVSHAEIRFLPERVVPSVLHDATYHFLLLSYVFTKCSKPINGKYSMLAVWLKLLQFAAGRPELVDDLDRWLGAQRQRQPNIEEWLRLPRGYLTDATHDLLVNYLEIAEYVQRSGDEIVSGRNAERLGQAAEMLVQENLLCCEREIVDRLAVHHVTKKSLGAA